MIIIIQLFGFMYYDKLTIILDIVKNKKNIKNSRFSPCSGDLEPTEGASPRQTYRDGSRFSHPYK